MGSPLCQKGRGAYNEPETQVTLTHDFEISQAEITQAEWTALGLANPSRPPRAPDIGGDCLQPSCPVGFVTWYEAAAFTNAYSQSKGLEACYTLQGCTGTIGVNFTCTGVVATHANQYECVGYRLPTDPEWEYAARAGTRMRFYSGDQTGVTTPARCEDVPGLSKDAWYCFTAPDRSTRPGCQKEPNGWGLCDVLGNVFEWTSNAPYKPGYPAGPLVDFGSELGVAEERPIRGGSVVSSSWYTAISSWISPNANSRWAGLRLVRTLSAPARDRWHPRLSPYALRSP